MKTCRFFFFPSLSYLFKHNTLQVNLSCCKWQHFILFLWLINISLYIYSYFFTHSSVDGHLGCLQIFANLKNAAMNIRRRQWQPTPVLLPGKSHGRRSLVGCSPWGREESGTTEQLHFHFSLSCIGEGNGNPLQCSCLENPRDGGAWWAAVYGVAQSQTRLKRLSSSSYEH